MSPISDTFPEQAVRTNARSGYFKVIAIVFLLPLAIMAVESLVYSIRCLYLHNDTTYPEGANVYAFLTAFHTGHLYISPFDPPWNAEIYGPLFFCLGYFVAWVCHGDPWLVTVMFRLLVFASFAGTIVVLVNLSRYLNGRSWFWTTTVALLALGGRWAIPMDVTCRADVMSASALVGAVAVYFMGHGRLRNAFYVGLLCSVSVLMKQSALLMCLGVIGLPLLEGKPRRMAVAIAGAIPIPLLILIVLRREPIWANVSTLAHCVIDWHIVPGSFLGSLRSTQSVAVPFLLALVGAVKVMGIRRWWPVLAITLLSGVSCISSLANPGGGSYYLIPFYFLTLLFVPAGLNALMNSARFAAVAVPVLGIVGLAVLIHQRNLIFPRMPVQLDASPVQRLALLSDIPYLEMRSRNPVLLDPYLYHDLELGHGWRSTELNRSIDREDYDLVLVSGYRNSGDFVLEGYRGISVWGPETVRELTEKYRALCEVNSAADGAWLALVPKYRTDAEPAVRPTDIGAISKTPCYSSDLVLRVPTNAE